MGSAPGIFDFYGPITVTNVPKKLAFDFEGKIPLEETKIKTGKLFATVNATNKAQMTESKRSTYLHTGSF